MCAKASPLAGKADVTSSLPGARRARRTSPRGLNTYAFILLTSVALHCIHDHILTSGSARTRTPWLAVSAQDTGAPSDGREQLTDALIDFSSRTAPSPLSTNITRAYRNAGLPLGQARFCGSLFSTLTAIQAGLLPALAGQFRSVGYTSPSLPGVPLRDGLPEAAVEPCRVVQGAFGWLMQAWYAGYEARCYIRCATADGGYRVAPTADVELVQLVREVTNALADGSVDNCMFGLPGEWGRPYDADLEAAYDIDSAFSGTYAEAQECLQEPSPRRRRSLRGVQQGRRGAAEAAPAVAAVSWAAPVGGGPAPSAPAESERIDQTRRRRLQQSSAAGSASQHNRATGPICEASLPINLSCPASMTITGIDYAFYGRNDNVTCSYSNPVAMRNTRCESPNFAAAVRSVCLGASSCSVGTYLVPDPCLDTYKFAVVRYTCFQTPVSLDVRLLDASVSTASGVARGQPVVADRDAVSRNRTVAYRDSGSICDDDFDDSDATVVCRQLGYTGGGRAYDSATFGDAAYPFWVDELDCSGNETAVGQCGRNPLGDHDCSNGEAAGVLCYPAFNGTRYCQAILDSISLYSVNSTSWLRPLASDASSGACGKLVGLATAVTASVLYQYPGQSILSQPEVEEPPCWGLVRGPLQSWLSALQEAVDARGCDLVPHVWMFDVEAPPPPPPAPLPLSAGPAAPPAICTLWPTAENRAATVAATSYSAYSQLKPPSTYMSLDASFVNGGKDAAAFCKQVAAGVSQHQALADAANLFLPSTLKDKTALAFTIDKLVNSPELKWLSPRFRNVSHLVSVLTSFSRPGGIDLLSNDVLWDLQQQDFSASPTPLQSPSPLTASPKPSASPQSDKGPAASPQTWFNRAPTPSSTPVSTAPAVRSGTGSSAGSTGQLNTRLGSYYGTPIAGGSAAFIVRHQALCASYDVEDGGNRVATVEALPDQCQAPSAEAKETLSAIAGLQVTGRISWRGSNALSRLLCAKGEACTQTTYVPTWPAVNLAFLEVSGVTEDRSAVKTALPVPVLYVKLGSSDWYPSEQAIQAHFLEEDDANASFASTLVLDLSGNGLSGTLPSEEQAGGVSKSVWRTLLSRAAVLDLSGNALDGVLPAYIGQHIREMDINVSWNPLLQNPPGKANGVPGSWLLAAAERADCPIARTSTSPPPLRPDCGTPFKLDFTGCYGLSGIFNAFEFGLMRVAGSNLRLDWDSFRFDVRQDKDGLRRSKWAYVINRVSRLHMDFQQIAYSAKSKSTRLFAGRYVIEPDDAVTLCNLLGKDVERALQLPADNLWKYPYLPSFREDSRWSALGVAEVHDRYKDWQRDPAVWCFGGWQARGRRALAVWLPAVLISGLACCLALPLHHWAAHDSKGRKKATQAAAGATSQPGGADSGAEPSPAGSLSARWSALTAYARGLMQKAAAAASALSGRVLQLVPASWRSKASEGGPAAAQPRRGYSSGAVWSYLKAAWRVIQPRLILTLFWFDIISDMVFVIGYKTWGDAPAPPVIVLLILLANMVVSWVFSLVHVRKHLGAEGWSKGRCVAVGILTAPLGMLLELLWAAGMTSVVYGVLFWAFGMRTKACSGCSAGCVAEDGAADGAAPGQRPEKAAAEGQGGKGTERLADMHAVFMRRKTKDLPVVLQYDTRSKSLDHKVLLEPLCESFPQAIVQTTCYVVGRNAGFVILTPIFLFSAILSAISITLCALKLAHRVFKSGSWVKVLMLQDEAQGTFHRRDTARSKDSPDDLESGQVSSSQPKRSATEQTGSPDPRVSASQLDIQVDSSASTSPAGPSPLGKQPSSRSSAPPLPPYVTQNGKGQEVQEEEQGQLQEAERDGGELEYAASSPRQVVLEMTPSLASRDTANGGAAGAFPAAQGPSRAAVHPEPAR